MHDIPQHTAPYTVRRVPFSKVNFANLFRILIPYTQVILFQSKRPIGSKIQSIGSMAQKEDK